MASANPEDGELYDRAVSIIVRDGRASTGYLQRCLQVGYTRAAELIEQLEREGIIGAPDHLGRREVLRKPGHEAA